MNYINLFFSSSYFYIVLYNNKSGKMMLNDDDVSVFGNRELNIGSVISWK